MHAKLAIRDPDAVHALLGIEHPVVSAGMGGGHTNGDLVGRVLPAADVVRRVVHDAEEIIRTACRRF